MSEGSTVTVEVVLNGAGTPVRHTVSPTASYVRLDVGDSLALFAANPDGLRSLAEHLLTASRDLEVAQYDNVRGVLA